ncbi:MAG TPA: hypothetical protein DCS07_15815, partial [Bdellovibrionales bacterium]|nr:hypothetical protein [Bdellovibrionales bacterium]
VQRPDIQKIIENDISLLAFLAGLLEKYIPETRVLNPGVIVDEFFRTLTSELDFKIEANNMVRVAENLKGFPEIVIPKVYRQFSTVKILTLEKLDGIPANDLAAIERANVDKKLLVEVGARAFVKSVMIDGLFHGDMHGGNLLIIPGTDPETGAPKGKLGIIDFGIVGRLSQRSRDQLANMVMALISEDFENLCYIYAELGAADPSINFEGFQREVRNNIAPLMGLTLGEINVGQVLSESTRIAAKYNIQIPGEWMIVFKAILTMESLGRTLDPEFDLLRLGQDIAKELVANQYSMQRLSKDLLWVAKDMASLLQVVPRQIRWMFRKFNSNDFAFEIKSPDLEAIRGEIDQHGRRTSLSVITAGLFMAGAIGLQYSGSHTLFSYPFFSIIFFAAGFLFLITLLLKSFR